jgi:peptidoglycan/LPS O-acetylase OafA/YrhL
LEAYNESTICRTLRETIARGLALIDCKGNTLRGEINHFSIEQTALLKGVGILLIVLHNFFHNLNPVIGENEFAFSYQIFRNIYQTLLVSPENLLRAIFSYFGHYGVQIFIFFSSYGLTRKYQKKPLIFSEFFKDRIYKIYLSFLLCLAVYVFLGLIKASFLVNEKVLYWDSLLWKILLVSNFIPGQALMPVGPWWFLPFIIQVYLLYPILLKGYRKYGYTLLVLVSLASLLGEWLINPYLILHGTNINHMVFGHLPVVCLGIVLAVQKAIKISTEYTLLALSLFVLGNFNQYIWMVADISFTILFLAISIIAFKTPVQHTFMTGFFIFYGNISFQLFMVNGFLRSPFHNFAETHNLWWIDNLAALASLLFSTLCAFFLSKIDKRLRRLFK